MKIIYKKCDNYEFLCKKIFDESFFFHNHLHVYFSICMYEMSERRRENSKEVLWM